MESLQRCVLHRIAVHFWELNYDFRRRLCRNRDADRKKLEHHRKRVQDRILKLLPRTLLPSPLMGEIIRAVRCLQRSYEQLFAWESRFVRLLGYTIENPRLHYSQYSRFLHPDGYFNDVAYARHIVTDVTQPLLNRWTLACCYCFEEFLESLYSAIKMKCNARNVTDRLLFHPLYIIDSRLTLLWAQHFDEYPPYHCECQFEGIVASAKDGDEHAARFFWARCSEAERTYFLREKCSRICESANKRKDTGVAYFLYTLLTPEMKMQIYLHKYSTMMCIWNFLLDSEYYYESVVDDIISLLHANLHDYIFSELTKAIEKRMPRRKQIFKTLLRRKYGIECEKD